MFFERSLQTVGGYTSTQVNSGLQGENYGSKLLKHSVEGSIAVKNLGSQARAVCPLEVTSELQFP